MEGGRDREQENSRRNKTSRGIFLSRGSSIFMDYKILRYAALDPKKRMGPIIESFEGSVTAEEIFAKAEQIVQEWQVNPSKERQG